MRKYFSVFLFLIVVVSLFANVREAYIGDTAVSGGLSGSARVVELSKESLTVSFPELDVRNFDIDSTLDIEVLYTLKNTSDEPTLLSVQFVGVGMSNASVTLDGEELSTEYVSDPEAESDFLTRLANHRKEFKSDLYGHFFNKLHFALLSRELIETNHKAEYAIHQIDNSDVTYSELAHMTFRSTDHISFSLLEFKLYLMPGKNELSINYDQSMYYNERSPGYGGFHLEKGTIGFDYLLYPAEDWVLADNFKLDIEVSVPRIRDRFLLLFSRGYPVSAESNLELEEEYLRKEKTQVYTGSFEEFPAEIFSFLVEME